MQEGWDTMVLWDNPLFQSCLRLLSILSLCVSDAFSQFSSIVRARRNYPHLTNRIEKDTGRVSSSACWLVLKEHAVHRWTLTRVFLIDLTTIVQPCLLNVQFWNQKRDKKCKPQLSGVDTSSSAQHSKEVVWLSRILHAFTSTWDIRRVGLADRGPYVCSRYKRVFSVGTHGITTYNPTTLEVTNQVSKCTALNS